MKKISVLLVLMLLALMLFVSCESKPKERDATQEDLKIIGLLQGACEYAIEFEPSGTKVEYIEDVEGKATFNNVKVTTPSGDVIILCGSASESRTEGIINLTSGTSVNGKGHTYYFKITKAGYECVLDGVKLNMPKEDF